MQHTLSFPFPKNSLVSNHGSCELSHHDGTGLKWKDMYYDQEAVIGLVSMCMLIGRTPDSKCILGAMIEEKKTIKFYLHLFSTMLLIVQFFIQWLIAWQDLIITKTDGQAEF